MYRYFMQLKYNGKNYHGWQIQPNSTTVQEVITKAFSTLTRQTIQLVGAGRTDTGVHASFYVAHFEVENPLQNTKKTIYQLNGLLPRDISVQNIFLVDNELHARFSAESRTYHYVILNDKDPFFNDFATYIPFPLSIDEMNKAALLLKDYIDFTSFSKLHTDVKTNNCKISKAEWYCNNQFIVFEIQADRFLRNMVRSIVGTLLEVGKDKLTLQNFQKIIEAKDRSKAGVSVDARGLYLTNIKYPETLNCQFKREDFFFKGSSNDSSSF